MLKRMIRETAAVLLAFAILISGDPVTVRAGCPAETGNESTGQAVAAAGPEECNSGEAAGAGEADLSDTLSANGSDPEYPVKGEFAVGDDKKKGTWVLTGEGVLTVTYTGEELFYGEMEDPISPYKDEVKSIVIDIARFSMRDNSFAFMPNLERVEFSENTEIDTDVSWSSTWGWDFSFCPMLSEIVVKNKNAKYALSQGANALIVGSSLCYGCMNTVIPEGVTGIAKDAFQGAAISSVSFPESLLAVGENAFRHCTGLSSVTFPEKVWSIGDSAFYNCTGLSYLIFKGPYHNGSSIMSIREKAFDETSSLKDVYLDISAKDWKELKKSVPGLKKTKLHSGIPEVCTVSFDTGYEQGLNPIDVIRGNTILSLPVPSRGQKYIFEGWYLDETLKTPFEEGKTVVDSAITLYGKWREAGLFTVTCYKPKGLTEFVVLEEKKIYEGQVYRFPTTEQLDLPKGYHVADWYGDESLTKRVNPQKPVTGDLKLYPKLTDLKNVSRWSEVVDKNGSAAEVYVGLDHTSVLVYDGRKHVAAEVGGKKTPATVSVNPDVRIEDFLVMVGDEYLEGITLSACSYRNNVKPTYIDHNEKYMYVDLKVKYDTNDPAVKAALSKYKNLKSVISKMLKPRYGKHKISDEPGDYYYDWSYDPIEIRIDQIELSESTPVYTTQEYDSNEAVKKMNGILIWDGGGEKKSFWKKNNVFIPTSVVLPGLRYQVIFDLGNGNSVSKQIPLKPGKYSVKTVVTGEGKGLAAVMSTKSFDYYQEDPGAVTEANKDAYVQPVLNSRWEDWEYVNKSGRLSYRANAGFFKGKLPDFDTSK